MEVGKTARIWTPKEKPVVLDKFCHLSLDAQKVMASMYRDFHQRRAEITRDIGFHTSESSLMPSKKRDRFEGGSFQEHRLHVDSDYRHGLSDFNINETENTGYRNTDKFSLPIAVTDVTSDDLKQPGETLQSFCHESTGTHSVHIPESIYQSSKNTLDSPAVETRDFEILSQFQVVDTQRDLFSESENDGHRWLANTSKKMRLDNNGIDTIDIGNHIQDHTAFDDHVTTHKRGNRLRSLDVEMIAGREKSNSTNYLNETSAVQQHPFKILEENRDMIDKESEGRVFVSHHDACKDNTDIGKVVGQSVDAIRKVVTPLCSNEPLCEESPYLDESADVTRQCYRTPDTEKRLREELTAKQRPKLKQTKLSFEKIRSNEDIGIQPSTIIENKHCREEDAAEIPVKILKHCNVTQDVSGSSVSTKVVYIHELTMAEIDCVCSELLRAEEIVFSLVFTNGSTQLRENLFGTDSKAQRKPGGKLKKDVEIDSVVLWRHDGANCKLYLFSVQNQRPPVYEKLREFWCTLLGADRVRKIAFQAKDVLLALTKHFNFDHNRVDLSWTLLDASIAFWLLDPDKPASSFEQLVSALKLGPQTPTKSCTDALLEDMGLLSLAMKKLYKLLNANEMWTLFVCLETKLVNVLAGMELRQISISIHTLLQFSAILKKSLKKLEEKAHNASGHAFLLNSHHQLRQVLFEELKLDSHLPGNARLAKTNVTRETSTSETVLTQLQPFHPLPAIILEYRQLQKLKSTYVDGILSCVTDNHLTTHWDQTSAATGRLTSHRPNIQAIPKLPVTIRKHETNYVVSNHSAGSDDRVLEFSARDPFISKPQWSLLAADFQQIELRLLGHLANDPVLISLFTDPNIPDIFNALAAQWLGKDITDITEADREQTKRVVYSVMYGVGKDKLADYLKCTPDSAKAIMDSFLLKFPAVNQFTKSCVEFCKKNGYTCSIFKRRRLFPNIKHSSPALRAQAERQCVNFCVQGSAADICKAAMLQVEKALAENHDVKARLLVQIHDELLFEVSDTDLNKVAGLVKNVMESEEKLCGSIVRLKVPIPVSLSVGKKWGHMQSLEDKVSES